MSETSTAEAGQDGLQVSLPARRGAFRSWRDSTLASFESPAYRQLWYGTFIAFIAFNMAGTAQNIVAFDLTGDNRAVGTVMFGQGTAMLILNPFGGAIADRLNRHFLLIATQAVIGGIGLTIAILLSTGLLTIPLLVVAALVTGSMFSFLVPTRTSMLGDMVPKDRIGNAMALVQVSGNFGRICAPFLAGILISWSTIGAAGTYYIIASMFIIVLLFMSRIEVNQVSVAQQSSVLDDLKSGIHHVTSNMRLLHGIISHYFLTALGFCFFVLMPGYVKNELMQGNAEIGVLLGVGAVGGLIGSVIVASLADSRHTSLFLKVVGLLSVAGLIGVGLATGLVLAMVSMFAVGGGVAAFQTLNNAVALHQTEREYYGRVMGLMQVAWGCLLLVSLPIGALADAFGERAVFTGAGMALGSVLFLMALWERQIGRTERRAHP